jgi:hypothetical protein
LPSAARSIERAQEALAREADRLAIGELGHTGPSRLERKVVKPLPSFSRLDEQAFDCRPRAPL